MVDGPPSQSNVRMAPAAPASSCHRLSAAAGALAAAVLGLLVVSPTPASAATPTVVQWGNPGNSKYHLSPTVVGGLPSDIVAVQASNWGGMALDGSGNVWDWGSGIYGDLGDGKKTSSPNVAVEVQGPTNVVSIGEGNHFGAAVDRSGDLWVWGWNADGQICLNRSEVSVAQPVEFAGFGAAAVAGGGNHLVIQMANGTVEACGLNSSGELGDGTITASSKPVDVIGLADVVAISAGNKFSAALEANGSVWTWGYDRFGQLGIGSTHNQKMPQQVSLPGPATEIYAGGDEINDGHMLVVLADGEVMAWGNDAYNQLGDGSVPPANATTPQVVTPPAGVSYGLVAAGGAGSFAIDTNGGLWAWGGHPQTVGNGSKLYGLLTPVNIGSGFTLLSATSNEAVGLTTNP